MSNPNVKIYDQQGGEVIADTNEHTGDWKRLQTITATTIASYTGNVSGLAGVALPANFSINGSFSVIDLTSGSLIAYTR